MNEDQIAKVVKSAMIEVFDEIGLGCCAKNCMERCSITPVDHADHHKFVGGFRQNLQSAKQTAQRSLIGAGLVGLITLLVLGFKAFIGKAPM